MKCTLCKKEFLENESMGSDFMWCQECWESECGKEWWKTMRDMCVELKEYAE